MGHVAEIGARGDITCALREEGGVWCWGGGTGGDVETPPGHPSGYPETPDAHFKLRAIDLGGKKASRLWVGDRSCAKVGADVLCWDNLDTVAKVEPTFAGATSVSWPCAIVDGVGVCTDSNLTLEDPLAPSTGEVDAGTEDGATGDAIGDAAEGGADAGQDASPATQLVQVGVGAERCVRTKAGDVYCGVKNVLQKVIRVDHALDLQVGPLHACARLAPDKAASGHSFVRMLCWGDHRFGQITYERRCDIPVHSLPPLANGPIDACGESLPTEMYSGRGALRMAVGGFHTCAQNAQRIWCWGFNAFGQLGGPEAPRQSKHNEIQTGVSATSLRTWDEPLLVPGDAAGPMEATAVDAAEVHAIVAGRAHTCVIAGDNRVIRCFGQGRQAQLGCYDPDAPMIAAVPKCSTK